MVTSGALQRRLIVGAFCGGVLVLALLIGLAGVGGIPPEPTLGLITFVTGAITLSIGTWRWRRRPR